MLRRRRVKSLQARPQRRARFDSLAHFQDTSLAGARKASPAEGHAQLAHHDTAADMVIGRDDPEIDFRVRQHERPGHFDTHAGCSAPCACVSSRSRCERFGEFTTEMIYDYGTLRA
jgi:hypothetical protein